MPHVDAKLNPLRNPPIVGGSPNTDSAPSGGNVIASES